MDRRTFLAGTGAILLAAPLAAEGQQTGDVPRIGLITGLSESMAQSRVDAFRQALRELGLFEGRTIVVEYHYLDGHWERSSTVVSELLRLGVNVIVAHGTPPALAAKHATSAVPIVIYEVGDPVGSGLVSSLARPGGNVTGVAQLVAHEIYGKQLQILAELIPGLSRVALLSNPSNLTQASVEKQTQAGATALGLKLVLLHAQAHDDLEKALVEATRERVAALVVARDALFFNHVRQLVELTAIHRVPTIYGYGAFAQAGGLIGYGPDPVEITRRTAALVAKILKGTKPADLPVEQPTKFELVINLKTAKALGLTIPPSLLGRADEVVQ